MRVPTWWGPDGVTVWVEWNEVTNEIEAGIGVNPSALTWKVTYVWKDREDSFTMPPGMPETTVGIPPGQRKRLRSSDGSLCKSPDIDSFNVEVV